MIKNRGNIKWQGMMLTEHVDMLNDWKSENETVERPELDEWELTLIAEEIERAHKSKATIKLTYWRDGYVKNDYGVPIEINTSNKIIVIDHPFGTTKYSFSDMVGATLVTE